MGKKKDKESTVIGYEGEDTAGKIAVENEVNKTKRLGRNVIILIILAILIGSSFVITQENKYSVITQFGNIVAVHDTPGLSFKIPLIQSVTSVDKQLMFYDIAPSDVITSDKKTMIEDAYVIWTVTDARKYIQTLSGSNSNAEGRLNVIVYNAIKNTISSMTQNEVILSRDGKIVVSDMGDEEITNDIVADDDETDDIIKIKSLTEEIRENLTDCSDYGIEIVKAEIKILDLPDDNKQSVYQRMISERENVAAAYTAQGKSEAQKIINTTNKEVAVMKANANASAAEIIAEGEAEYMKILSEAYNQPEKSSFYSFIRSLDAAKASLKGNNNTLILDQNSPIAQIFYN